MDTRKPKRTSPDPKRNKKHRKQKVDTPTTRKYVSSSKKWMNRLKRRPKKKIATSSTS